MPSSNVIRKTMMPGRCSKACWVVHIPARTIGGLPCFTEWELRWIEANVKEPEHLEFLWKARAEDPLYACAPEPEGPPRPEQTPEAKAAMQECMAFMKSGWGKKK